MERALDREGLLLRRALRIGGTCTVSDDLNRVITSTSLRVAGTSDDAMTS